MESGTATQLDIGFLENLVDMNFLKFIKDNCQVLHLGWNNPMQDYQPARKQICKSLRT